MMEGGKEGCNVSLSLGFSSRLGLEGQREESLREESSLIDNAKKRPNLHPTNLPQDVIYGDDESNRVDFRKPKPDHGESSKSHAKKKLQLTKEQIDSLEESFVLSNIIDPVQKQELAERLGLRSRQIEVWFQNRRARTKVKHTKMECEMLKICNEKLREENQRLKMENWELKSYLESSTAFFCPPMMIAPNNSFHASNQGPFN